MKYEIYWMQLAEAQAMALWLRANDRELVMDAIDDANRILSESADEQGESRSTETDRIWFHPPLKIAYRLHPNREEVDVLAVKWIGN